MIPDPLPQSPATPPPSAEAAPVATPPGPGSSPAPGAVSDPSAGTVPSPEPGYTTTEFWMAVPVAVVGLLETLGVIHLGPTALQAIAGLVLLVAPSVAYILGRSIRKAGFGG